MGQPAYVIRDATENDRHHLANLIHFQAFVHRHLDWRTPLEWLGSQPYLVLERGQRLEAVLACPPDSPEIAWLRLFGVDSNMDAQEAWQILWPAVRQMLAAYPGLRACALALQPWFAEILRNSHFTHTNDVILLMWDAGSLSALPPPKPCTLRAMLLEDLEAVCQVDQRAFSPEWRNSRSDLEFAFKQSASATVVIDAGQVVGYQLSTAGPMGGHLARLAVLPELQGRGLGYALVHHLLREFSQRGANHVTVSTQSDNLASQALYHKAGFGNTNEAYQVYQTKIH